MAEFGAGNGKVDTTHWTVVNSSERFHGYAWPPSLSFKFCNTASWFSARKETLYNYSGTSGQLWGKWSGLPRATGRWTAVEKISDALSCGPVCAAPPLHWARSQTGLYELALFALRWGGWRYFCIKLCGSPDWITPLKLGFRPGTHWGTDSGEENSWAEQVLFPTERLNKPETSKSVEPW